MALSGVLNLVGAFLSLSVAATIASGLVQTGLVTLPVVFAGLIGGDHLEPADLAARHPVQLLARADRRSDRRDHGRRGRSRRCMWHGLFQKVIIPAGLSPIIAGRVAATGT